VYERWYSKELQLTIMSRRADPRTGEQIYRLTNINRTDPPATMFQPPADYTVTDHREPKNPPVKISSTEKKVPAAARKAGTN
jgi:hypothetical protein